MTALDDRILEHLRDEDWATPATMAADLRFDASRDRLDERCRVLSHAGLIEPWMDTADADTFELTRWGKLYLDGEVDADLRRPLPRPRPPDKVRPRAFTGV